MWRPVRPVWVWAAVPTGYGGVLCCAGNSEGFVRLQGGVASLHVPRCAPRCNCNCMPRYATTRRPGFRDRLALCRRPVQMTCTIGRTKAPPPESSAIGSP